MAQNKRETLRSACAELRGLLESIEQSAAGLPEQDLSTVMKNIWTAKESIEGAAEIVDQQVCPTRGFPACKPTWIMALA